MTEDELAELTERGVVELDLAWPAEGTVYEVPIPRIVVEPDGTERPHRTLQEYFTFLRVRVSPLVRVLESQAGVRYWHVLNHGQNIDLRIAIEDERQRGLIDAALSASGLRHLPIRPFGPYKDPGLGSRLGCQALMRLYLAQSRFVMDLIESIHWCGSQLPADAADALSNAMAFHVPIYTSHTLMNVFPSDQLYEASIHLQESLGRFRMLAEGVPPGDKRQVIDGVVADLEAALMKLGAS